MEVSSHALDQRRTAGLDFRVGVFTNLTGDHLDYHKTMEEYLRAKRWLFEALGPDATAVLNQDDPTGRQLASLPHGRRCCGTGSAARPTSTRGSTGSTPAGRGSS